MDLIIASDDPGKEEFLERVNSRHGQVTMDVAAEEGYGTKEYEGSTYRGVRIIPFSESGDIKQIADNGYVYYIDSVLLYDYTTRNKILNRRIRIDCSTLSPDFITSGARQKYMGENVSGDRPGFGFRDPTNWKAINSNFTTCYIVELRTRQHFK